jgi:catechol 2,3-dioxygenase-like lactoylglutathione lyase family enzyme
VPPFIAVVSGFMSIATMSDRPPQSAILETALSVADLQRARDFYTTLFGYPLITTDERFCAFRVGEHQVLLLFLRGSDPSGTQLPFGFIPSHGTTGASHVAFSISKDNIPTWLARLADQNITVESQFTWPLGGTSIYFRDPDGHLLELITPGVWGDGI